jgi:hypothetical protein
LNLRDILKLIILALFWLALLMGYELKERERRHRKSDWDAAVLYRFLS